VRLGGPERDLVARGVSPWYQPAPDL